jgi:hypothetical protein
MLNAFFDFWLGDVAEDSFRIEGEQSGLGPARSDVSRRERHITRPFIQQGKMLFPFWTSRRCDGRVMLKVSAAQSSRLVPWWVGSGKKWSGKDSPHFRQTCGAYKPLPVMGTLGNSSNVIQSYRSITRVRRGQLSSRRSG